MVHPAPTNHEIVTAYRHLSQLARLAVRKSQPASTTLQTRLRLAFRLSPRADFDAARIRNTCTFLYNAARYPHCIEHEVTRQLAFVWYFDLGEGALPGIRGRRNRDLEFRTSRERSLVESHRARDASMERKWQKQGTLVERRRRMDYFNHVLRMLNESMGLCLR